MNARYLIYSTLLLGASYDLFNTYGEAATYAFLAGSLLGWVGFAYVLPTR